MLSKQPMKAFKNIFLPIIVIIGLTILYNRIRYDYTWLIVLFILLSVYVISGIFRYKRWAVNYFLSPFSFLHGKVREEIKVDLPPKILFEKILEFYQSFKDYKVVSYEGELIINAGTPFSGFTWTENIIIKVSPSDDGESSTVDFTSLTFAVFSWGKNAENLEEFKAQLDQSFFVV